MVVLGRGLRQLDHWRRTNEDLTAPIKYEMVMRSHERERNAKRAVKRLG